MLYSNKKRVDEICEKITDYKEKVRKLNVHNTRIEIYSDGDMILNIKNSHELISYKETLLQALVDMYNAELELLHNELKEL